MRHRVAYQEIRQLLHEHRCAFTVLDWKERHKPTDLLTFDGSLRLEPNCAFLGGDILCSMGAFSYTWSALPPHAQVGRFCSIARGLTILGTRHPYERVTTSSMTYDANFCIFKDSEYPIRPKPKTQNSLQISDDVWIGQNVTLARDLRVGRGAVIAANSMVVKDVKPYEIVGGNPARHIKWRFPEATIALLEASKWWTYHPRQYAHLDMSDPVSFAQAVIAQSAQQNWLTYQPDCLTTKKLIRR